MDQGIFARLQVGHLPFERNWQHLPGQPTHFFLEAKSSVKLGVACVLACIGF